jgi:hypothetical protein
MYWECDRGVQSASECEKISRAELKEFARSVRGQAGCKIQMKTLKCKPFGDSGDFFTCFVASENCSNPRVDVRLKSTDYNVCRSPAQMMKVHMREAPVTTTLVRRGACWKNPALPVEAGVGDETPGLLKAGDPE